MSSADKALSQKPEQTPTHFVAGPNCLKYFLTR